MCTPILDFWYLFHIRTNKFPVMKISQYYAFAVIDIVAPWNRPQERRCMPGLQGPQPSFMSKIPICECFKELSINIRRQRSNTGLLRTFGERKSLGKFPWTMKHKRLAFRMPYTDPHTHSCTLIQGQYVIIHDILTFNYDILTDVH